MKTKKFINQTLIIITLCPLFVFSQTKWEYPIKPGSIEWSSLKTIEEMISVQQIPEEILKQMSTDEVFEAYMDLPGRLEVLAFNTMQKGFNVTKQRYNVLAELLRRDDIGKVVLKKHLKLDPAGLKKEWEHIKKGKYITDFGFIEFLLSQSEVLSTLSKTNKQQLFKKIISDLTKKMNSPKGKKDFFWVESGLILAGRILHANNNSAFMGKMKLNIEIANALTRGEIRSKTDYEKLYNAVTNILIITHKFI